MHAPTFAEISGTRVTQSLGIVEWSLLADWGGVGGDWFTMVYVSGVPHWRYMNPEVGSGFFGSDSLLGESTEPMNTKEMIEAMSTKGYWSSPGGKTPHVTLYSAILREIQKKGEDARFQKSERGRFILKNG